MFFRFCSALVLVVLIAATGISIEKRLLNLKREQTLQIYRREQLEERFARLRLRSHELGAPARLIDSLAVSAKSTHPRGTDRLSRAVDEIANRRAIPGVVR